MWWFNTLTQREYYQNMLLLTINLFFVLNFKMKKKFLKISNDLIENSLNNGPLAFIFRTKIHAILVFNIFGSERITFESLCKNLDSVASRTTIQTILIEGVKKNYLTKEIDKDDKRKKYYNCINLKDTLDEWYKNNKIIFS